MPPHQVIHLHRDAPAKPAAGAACNGCGVCCASEPCPLGMLVSRRRRGACAALVWVDAERQYRCGLILQPAGHLPAGLRWVAPALARAARRWVAAGRGCDAWMDVQRPPRQA